MTSDLKVVLDSLLEEGPCTTDVMADRTTDSNLEEAIRRLRILKKLGLATMSSWSKWKIRLWYPTESARKLKLVEGVMLS